MSLHFKFFNDKELKQMDALKESYGGAAEIMKSIDKMRQYDERKKTAQEKGFGRMLEQARRFRDLYLECEA